MKKFLLIITLMLIPTVSFGANQWRNSTGEDTPLGTEEINNLDDVLFQRVTDPLDRLNANYNQGATVVYNSASTIDITAGSVTCSTAGISPRAMRQNTSTVNATFAGNLDTGAEASSTVYYVWADCDTDATTFTVKISASSSAPTGVTSYALLGSFFNDSGSDIDRTRVYQVPFGYIKADSTGRGLVTDVRDYGTSSSSYTAKTGGDLKIAFGQVSVSPDSTATISNLPFTSTSTFKCQATFDQNVTNDDGFAGCTPASASTLTIINQQGAGSRTIQWFAIGY